MLELVMDMEADKVADEDMEVDMEVDWHGEEFIDVTLAIGGQISINASGQIFNWCKWCHLVVVYIVVDMDVDKVANMVVKIPNDYYWCDWRLVILKEMVIGVVDVEVDKTLCEISET